jgi:AraC-like DNA-binding protein
MKATVISSCSISPDISAEQFIPEHFFLYLVAGAMSAYDGSKAYTVKAGDYGLARRNHLAKYSKQPVNGRFEKVVIIFDQAFLQSFNETHQYAIDEAGSTDAIIPLPESRRIASFIESLEPYFNDKGIIDEDFFYVKRSELLLILLKEKPELANIFFDFGIPEKIDLEAFMNRNFRFNVTVKRFAYLTGRSLTIFKRDFESIFKESPSRWLIQKRLQEAYFQIEKNGKTASDIYLELGFENLSHFSFAFKKKFGITPTGLSNREKKTIS